MSRKSHGQEGIPWLYTLQDEHGSGSRINVLVSKLTCPENFVIIDSLSIRLGCHEH
jgi:hypothetical protein